MAAGIPVVASKTKIDTYYFNDSQIKFFVPEDHVDLSRCILELYHDPEKRAKMVENGKKYIEENHWDLKKQVYVDLLATLLK